MSDTVYPSSSSEIAEKRRALAPKAALRSGAAPQELMEAIWVAAEMRGSAQAPSLSDAAVVDRGGAAALGYQSRRRVRRDQNEPAPAPALALVSPPAVSPAATAGRT